jgi:hypothetical protein
MVSKVIFEKENERAWKSMRCDSGSPIRAFAISFAKNRIYESPAREGEENPESSAANPEKSAKSRKGRQKSAEPRSLRDIFSQTSAGFAYSSGFAMLSRIIVQVAGASGQSADFAKAWRKPENYSASVMTVMSLMRIRAKDRRASVSGQWS